MRMESGSRLLAAMVAIGLLALGTAARAAPVNVRAIVAERAKAAGAPGAAYAFVRDGRIEAGAVGLASEAEGTPLRSDTPLALGSVSKPFVAVGVLQLVDRGLVELDAPISRYLPWLRFAEPGAADRITVRHLLTHTSGISTFVGNRTQSDVSMEPGALRRRAELLADVTPGTPGADWQYSNSNYQLLGALIEQVSGLDYPTYVRKNIFEPLGMRHSFVLVPPPDIAAATGHRRWFGVLRPVGYRTLGLGSAPQGGVYASAEDMGKFLNAFLTDESPLMSQEMRAEMLTPQLGQAMQGIGWRITEKTRPGFIWHGGDSPGFAAFAGFDRRSGTGLAVMTNLGDNLVFAPAHGVTLGTASELFGLPPVPVRSSPLNIAIVVGIGVLGVVGIIHSVRLIKRRATGAITGRRRLKVTLSAGFGLALVLLAFGMLLLPRALFGAPISAAFVFMPDMIMLLTASGASLLLAGTMQLLLLFGRRSTSHP